MGGFYIGLSHAQSLLHHIYTHSHSWQSREGSADLPWLSAAIEGGFHSLVVFLSQKPRVLLSPPCFLHLPVPFQIPTWIVLLDKPVPLVQGLSIRKKLTPVPIPSPAGALCRQMLCKAESWPGNVHCGQMQPEITESSGLEGTTGDHPSGCSGGVWEEEAAFLPSNVGKE